MKDKIKLIKEYWTDKNGNKWKKELHTKNEAKIYSKRLYNCYDCIECVDCNNCI